MSDASPRSAWDQNLLRDPHSLADKRDRVRKMFAAIAPSYDLNNRLHSLWQDQRWRRTAVKLACLMPTDVVVDVACGTGDLTLRFHYMLMVEQINAQRKLVSPRFAQVLGVDFTYEMLPLAREKAGQVFFKIDLHRAHELADERRANVVFINGDAQSLPLPDACCDVVSIAFGIRNVQDPRAALREFHRILRPGGRVIILEFSLPKSRLPRNLYNFYFRHILPRTATWISGDKTGAYKYLPESVNTFIGRDQMMQMMREVGFGQVEQFPMTFGVCVCYRGLKVS